MADTIKFNRASNLELISGELEKNVKKHLEEGKVLHDATLRFLNVDIINRNKMDIKFVASDDWIWKWKRGIGLSSRKIKNFVASVRQLSFSRRFSWRGSDNINSYTVLPLIAADGTLHPKLFVTLKQKIGKFPKKGHYKASNLMITCHSSHIMTKHLMKVFFEKAVFDLSMPKGALLLVDSWSSWKDQSAIQSVKPAGNDLEVRIIHPGCTGLVQPCDVGIFGGFKMEEAFLYFFLVLVI